MSFVTIKQRIHQRLLNLLRETLNLVSPDSGRIEGMSNIISFDRNLLIIDSQVSIAGYEEFDLQKMRIVRDAIVRLSKYKVRTVPYFKKAIEAEVRTLRRRRRYQFYAVFPTLIDLRSLCGIKHFSLAGNIVEVLNLEQMKKRFNIDSATEHSFMDLPGRTGRFLVANQNDIAYLTLERLEPTPVQAFANAGKIMDLFRAIISFSLNRNMYHAQGGRPQPLAFVSCSPCYYVFDRNGGFKDYWLDFSSPINLHLRRLNSQQVRDITRFIELFNQGLQRGRNLTEKVLEPMLRQYGLALDQSDRDMTFLCLWQVLEFLALAHLERLPDKEKGRRIQALSRSEREKEVFECLYKRRNLLVHRGRFNVRLEDELNALKSLCDYSISFLFEKIDKMDDWRALKYYLQNVILGKTEINRKMGVLREIMGDLN